MYLISAAVVLIAGAGLLALYLYDVRSKRIADAVSRQCSLARSGCALVQRRLHPQWHGRFWRDWPPMFIGSLAIVFLCLVIFWLVVTPDPPITLERVHWRSALVIGSFSVTVLLAYFISRHDLPWRVWILVGLGSAFLVILFWLSAWTIPGWATAKIESWTWAERPGTAFVFVLGFITVTGFILTLSQLHETNARITDYTTLLRRLRHLLIEAHTWQSHGASGTLWSRCCRLVDRFRELDGGTEPVRIFARTLALGSLSTRAHVFSRYRDALKRLQGEDSEWRVVQLEHDTLPEIRPEDYTDDDAGAAALRAAIGSCSVGNLFLGFLKRQLDVRQIARGFKDACDLGEVFQRHLHPTKRKLYKRSAADSDGLPDYSLFISGRRAIVITALDVPIGRNPRPRGVGPVHVVAVETTNRQVIGELINTFDSIVDACEPPPAGISTPT